MDFAFRFERQTDLGCLLVTATNFCRKQDAYLRVVCVEADVVHLDTNLTLDKLRELMGTIPDGHLMADTVNFANQFTGDPICDVT